MHLCKSGELNQLNDSYYISQIEQYAGSSDLYDQGYSEQRAKQIDSVAESAEQEYSWREKAKIFVVFFVAMLALTAILTPVLMVGVGVTVAVAVSLAALVAVMGIPSMFMLFATMADVAERGTKSSESTTPARSTYLGDLRMLFNRDVAVRVVEPAPSVKVQRSEVVPESSENDIELAPIIMDAPIALRL